MGEDNQDNPDIDGQDEQGEEHDAAAELASKANRPRRSSRPRRVRQDLPEVRQPKEPVAVEKSVPPDGDGGVVFGDEEDEGEEEYPSLDERRGSRAPRRRRAPPDNYYEDDGPELDGYGRPIIQGNGNSGSGSTGSKFDALKATLPTQTILAMVVISMFVVFIMVSWQGPRIGVPKTGDITRLELVDGTLQKKDTAQDAEIVALDQNKVNNSVLANYLQTGALDGYVTSGSLTNALESYTKANTMGGYATDAELTAGLAAATDDVDDALDDIQDQVDEAITDVDDALVTMNAQNVAALTLVSTRANETADELEAMVAAALQGVEYSLDESGGDYTLDITSHEDAVYGVEVVLVWREGDRVALGDTTLTDALENFYARIDDPSYSYVPVPVWNDEGGDVWYWRLSEVRFTLDELEMDEGDVFDEEMELEDEMGDFNTEPFEVYVNVAKGVA